MKPIIFLFVVLLGIIPLSQAQTCVARYENRIPPDQNFFQQYPFANILDAIGNPDTVFICHLPNVYFEETDIPVAINLIVYKTNDLWRGTTLQTYAKKNTMEYVLMDTIPIYINLDHRFEMMKEELGQQEVWNGDISIDHTYLYIKCGVEVYITLLRSLPDFWDELPALTNFVSVCLFKTCTSKVINRYQRNR